MPKKNQNLSADARSADAKSAGAAKNPATGGKVGSDRGAAEHFAGGRDFGIPAEGAGRFTEIAEEAKYQPGGDHLSDPRPPRSGGGRTREAGVGGNDTGPGSSSGGDLDTDLIGVGTHGSGISSAGPDSRKRGPDMTKAGSDRHAVNPGTPQTHAYGTTINHSGGDSSTNAGMGSSSASASLGTGDDAGAGEISQGEAAGDDNTDSDNIA